MRTHQYHVVVDDLLHANSPEQLNEIIDAILALDPEWIAESGQQSNRECIRRDLASGLHEWRVRDMAAHAAAYLLAEREIHLELLRRREAAGIR